MWLPEQLLTALGVPVDAKAVAMRFRKWVNLSAREVANEKDRDYAF